MNHKQKAFYTLFGAVIMLIGMTVRAIVSPPLIAQRNGVLGEIQCTGLTVVDRSGEPAIVLRADEMLGNGVVIHNPTGTPAVLLVADDTGNSLAVVDKSGEPAVLLRTSELANRVIVRSPSGKDGVRLSAGKVTNRVTVYNLEETNAVQLYADKVTGRVSVHNKVVSSDGRHLKRGLSELPSWAASDTP